MLKLILLAVLVILFVRFLPRLRAWTAECLEDLARELRGSRNRKEPKRPRVEPHEDATEVMNTRAEPASRGRTALLCVEGRTVALRDGMTIGRDEGCAIRLKDSRASRRHARVMVQRGTVKIEDLGSRNGTRVSGRDLNGLHTLTDGDMISFGGSIAARFAYDEKTIVMHPTAVQRS